MSTPIPSACERLRQADACSLSGLSRRMAPGPLRLSALVACFADREGSRAFERLVATVFPKDYRRIMHPPDVDPQESLAFARMQALVACVERDYFPCQELWDPEMSCGRFLEAIPFTYRSWTSDDLHFLDARTDQSELLLITALAPFVRDDIGDAFFDLAARHVRAETLALLARIPPPEEHAWIAQWREHPRYGPLVDMLCWLRGSTGIAQLDFDPENFTNDIEWSLANLRWLRDEHSKAQAFLQRIGRLADWLDEEPAARLARLVHDVYREEIATLEQQDPTEETPAGGDGGSAGPGPDQLPLSLGAAAGGRAGRPGAAAAVLPY